MRIAPLIKNFWVCLWFCLVYHDFFRNAILFLPQFFPFSGFPCKKSNKMRINFCSSRHRVFPLFSKARFFRKNAPPAESGRGINILKNYFQNEGVFWPFPDQQYPRNRSSQKLCHRLRLQFSLVFALRIRLPRCSPPFLSRILYIIRDIFATGRQWCFQFSHVGL